MILGVEAHFRHAPRCARHRLRGRDHLPLLPEEVDQLEVRRAALGQQILGIVGEGQRDNFFALKLRTPQNFPPLVGFQIVHNEERPVTVLGECH